MTRQDILNCMKRVERRSGLFSDDALAVEQIADVLRKEHWNPILFYKGSVLLARFKNVHLTNIASNVPDVSKFAFDVNDFVLIIQTKTMHENLIGFVTVSLQLTPSTTRRASVSS